ncbi:GTP-binding protein [Kocuria sp. KSNUG]|uniref:CobW family GTP-binding protein n=1 Tax=Kocuria sp. KSNUG TaxID=3136676 RepID=UPI003C2BFC35
MPSLSIVGGYLGAGKSTVVNRLLAGVLPGRTAVVVNDFGAVNIDASLISSRGEDTIELTNGCICCQITDDVQRTMTALARRTDLDHVVCEVSGVGDPGQLGSWRRFPGFTAGPVLVCADATAIPRLLRDEFVGDTVARQLAAAETVLVTKTDLATPAEVDDAAALVRAAAPHVPVHHQDPRDPARTLGEMLATGPAATTGRVTGDADPSEPFTVRPAFPGADPAAAAPSHNDAHAARHRTVTIPCPAVVEIDPLLHHLQRLPERVVRAKGVVRDEAGAWHEVHLAGGRASAAPLREGAQPPEEPCLVLIAAGPEAECCARDSAATLLSLLSG